MLPLILGGADRDPSFASNILLLVAEAGDSVPIDKSKSARTVTVNGTVNIIADAASPTGHAFDFGAGNNYLTFGADTDFQMGTGDWTIDALGRVSDDTAANALCGTHASESTGTNVTLGYNGSADSMVSYFEDAGDSKSVSHVVDGTGASGVKLANDAYVHLAMARDGTNLRAFTNGHLDNTTTISGSHGLTNWDAFKVGIWASAATRDLDGRIAYFRVTKGVARWTASFSPFMTPPKF